MKQIAKPVCLLSFSFNSFRALNSHFAYLLGQGEVNEDMEHSHNCHLWGQLPSTPCTPVSQGTRSSVVAPDVVKNYFWLTQLVLELYAPLFNWWVEGTPLCKRHHCGPLPHRHSKGRSVTDLRVILANGLLLFQKMIYDNSVQRKQRTENHRASSGFHCFFSVDEHKSALVCYKKHDKT